MQSFFFFFLWRKLRGAYGATSTRGHLYYTMTCGILQTSRSSWKNTTQLTKNYLPLAGEFFLMYTQVNHNIDVIFDGYTSNVSDAHSTAGGHMLCVTNTMSFSCWYGSYYIYRQCIHFFCDWKIYHYYATTCKGKRMRLEFVIVHLESFTNLHWQILTTSPIVYASSKIHLLYNQY